MRRVVISSTYSERSLINDLGQLWRSGCDELEIVRFLKKQGVSNPAETLVKFKRSKGFKG